MPSALPGSLAAAPAVQAAEEIEVFQRAQVGLQCRQVAEIGDRARAQRCLRGMAIDIDLAGVRHAAGRPARAAAWSCRRRCRPAPAALRRHRPRNRAGRTPALRCARNSGRVRRAAAGLWTGVRAWGSTVGPWRPWRPRRGYFTQSTQASSPQSGRLVRHTCADRTRSPRCHHSVPSWPKRRARSSNACDRQAHHQPARLAPGAVAGRRERGPIGDARRSASQTCRASSAAWFSAVGAFDRVRVPGGDNRPKRVAPGNAASRPSVRAGRCAGGATRRRVPSGTRRPGRRAARFADGRLDVDHGVQV